MKKESTPTREKKMRPTVPWYNRTSITLATAVFFGFLGWLLYTSLEAFFFPTQPFLQLFLTDITLQDIILRIIVSGCFFIFGTMLIHTIAVQKQKEKTLQELNETLHLQNMSLEQKIQEKTKEIEQLLGQKNDLIVGLSHDLKTPLTPLMGLLPMIIRDEQDPKLKELLTHSLRNVHYIRDLVSRAIDLALLDSKVIGLTMEKTSLLTEVETILEHRFLILQDHHIDVDNKIDDQMYVQVDKLKLREVLNNLVMNSITFSSLEGGSITFDAKRKENEVVVSISDTGIGLTSEQTNHIFDELYKADEARHDHKKTGLGLTICKRIIEKHGGKIWVESLGPGKGTTVFFTLPTGTENETLPAH
jgi:signal transduction histidine kinase